MRIAALISAIAIAGCAARPDLDLDSPDAAMRYFAEKRGISGSFDINAAYRQASERIAAMHRLSALSVSAPAGSWHFLGPGNIAGRTGALLIDPNDPSTYYAGAVSGGVWKSTDAGASWSATTDWLPNLAANSLAFDPADSRVIYAGTGEGYFREDVRGTNLPIRGNGIFVTRDAAQSWEQLASTLGEDFYFVNDIVVSTHDSRRIYAATRTGVFRSDDGGQSWTHALSPNVHGGCLDLAFRGDGPTDVLFASCGTLAQASVWRSTKAESNDPWTNVLSEDGMSRTSLAIAPSHPSTIYALAARNGGRFDQGTFAVFRSTDNGDAGTWVAQVRGADPPTAFGQTLLTNVDSLSSPSPVNMGWYSNVIAVDPMNENRLWAAGVDLFRSDDAGRTWGRATFWGVYSTGPFFHADAHCIAFDPRYDGASNQTLFGCTDGGVFRTENSLADVAARLGDTRTRTKVVFHAINHNLGTVQFFHGAVFDNGTRYIGGAQDNTTPMGSDAAGVSGWTPTFGGDGGFVAIDPVTPSTMYLTAQFGQIVRSFDGGQTFRDLELPDETRFLFVSPFLMDPSNRQRLWIGGSTQLLRYEQTATAASAPVSSRISAIAVAPTDSNRILFGTTSGEIYRSTKALSAAPNTTWQSSAPRTGWVSSIVFDGTTAYATYSGFGGAHVWKSSDGGVTWTSPDGTLPDLPVHTIALDGSTIYIGTDLGVFVSSGGGDWSHLDGLPNTIVEAIVLSGRSLFAFTHGRGAWRYDFAAQPRRRVVR